MEGYNRRKKYFSPLVPGMQNIKIRQFITCCLLIVCFVKKLVRLEADYSERQGD